MALSTQAFFGDNFTNPLIRALCLSWAKNDRGSFAFVGGGYTSYRLGYTNKFSGMLHILKHYIFFSRYRHFYKQEGVW